MRAELLVRTARTRAVPCRRAARERAGVRLPVAGRGLGRRGVVGINPTRRGAELARDINHTDCQLIITDGSMRPLLDGIPLDLPRRSHPRHRRPGVAPTRSRSRPRQSARGELDSVRRAGPGDAVRAAVHVGFDGRAQGGADDAGPRRACGPDRDVRADDVLYCAMPLYHGNALEREPVLRAAFRRDDRAAPQVLRVGVPARCAALRRDVLQHRRPRAESHPLDARDRRRSQPLDQVRARARDRARRRARVPQALRRAGDRGLRLERERDHPDSRSDVAEGFARPAARRHRRRDPRSR